MPMFQVTYRLEVVADDPEGAALEADRLIALPVREFSVTGPRTPTVFVRVERGKAARVA
jgi:hypothetical protein